MEVFKFCSRLPKLPPKLKKTSFIKKKYYLKLVL
jgi:hypothetical protein